MRAAASARRRHLVAVAMTEGAPIFEVAIACEIFGRARPSMPDLGYDLRVCNPPGARVYASPVFASEGPDTYDTLARAAEIIGRRPVAGTHAGTRSVLRLPTP